MDLFEVFRQRVTEKRWWQPEENVLVAVSGGIDSVVLLHLMLRLDESIRPRILVAHVNHQLREASIKEELFIKEWCQKENIPFFLGTWQEGLTIQSNTELAAREFRYSFFDNIIKQEQVSTLLTGHHKGDQVETILMRLINGNRLNYLVGIEEERQLTRARLVRPLLIATKNDLYAYAKKEGLIFFEDETNQEATYLRNRIRNQLLPILREENPRFEEQLLSFQKELSFGLELIEQEITPKYLECLTFDDKRICIDRKKFLTYSKAEQHFILDRLVSDLQKQVELIINKKQQKALSDMLLGATSNQSITLKDNWQATRSYDLVTIVEEVAEEVEDEAFKLSLNEGVFVSEKEWFGLFETEKVEIPKKVKDWSQKELIIVTDLSEPLIIRRRQPGDKLIINEQGQTKKVRRYFIDEKIPLEKREKSWIVTDNEGELKWLVPFRESYLSIRDETDKIHYKLVYLYKKDK